MTKNSILRSNPRPSRLAFDVLQVRLSLRETQSEFARHFQVSKTTVYMWEKGRSKRMQRIYRHILDTLKERLQAEGRLLPDAAITVMFKEEVERLNGVV